MGMKNDKQTFFGSIKGRIILYVVLFFSSILFPLRYYFVPKSLSPASPKPGSIYPFSFNFSSMLAQ